MVRPVLLALLALTFVGCTSDPEPTTRPTSGLRARQEQAMRGGAYDPEFDRTDISGGGIDHYDPKGMKSDLDSIFLRK